jgi:hypothetical protein
MSRKHAKHTEPKHEKDVQKLSDADLTIALVSNMPRYSHGKFSIVSGEPMADWGSGEVGKIVFYTTITMFLMVGLRGEPFRMK